MVSQMVSKDYLEQLRVVPPGETKAAQRKRQAAIMWELTNELMPYYNITFVPCEDKLRETDAEGLV